MKTWPIGYPMHQLCCWLLQRTLKAGGAAGMAPQHRRTSSATLFGRMTLVKRKKKRFGFAIQSLRHYV